MREAARAVESDTEAAALAQTAKDSASAEAEPEILGGDSAGARGVQQTAHAACGDTGGTIGPPAEPAPVVQNAELPVSRLQGNHTTHHH